jgi:PhoH-like ATPase
MEYLVLDTNILLLDSSNLYTLSDQGKKVIVIPDIVIQELDSKKTLMEDIGYHARRTSGMLSDAKLINVDRQELQTIITAEYLQPEYSVTILLVSKKSYVDEKNDLKIIEVAEDFHKEFSNVTFLSNDTNCRFLALTKGIKVDFVREQEDIQIEPLIYLTVEPEVFEKLELVEATSINPNHTQENYAYHITSTTGNQAVFLVNNGKLESIDEDEVRKQEAPPRNLEQLVYSAAILSLNYDFIVCDALAGSGKSFAAIAAAMKLVRAKKFAGIYYLRNTVHNLERNEEVGFLPGADEKFAPFFAPLYDTLRIMIRKHLANKKMKAEDLELAVEEKLEEAMKSYNIKPITTLGLRGRTLTDSIIIMDEAQNFSPSSAQTALTRIGEGCMVIVIGSSRQIDNAYLNKYTTSLAVLLGALKKEYPNVKLFGSKLTKVVRGRLTEFAENIFSKGIK